MILVIGYGNSLCSDDGVGPYVVDKLSGETWGGDIQWLSLHQLTPELAEPISTADSVIFVDAAQGETPGQITWRKLVPLVEAGRGIFTHHVNTEILLGTAWLLYGRYPEAYLYTLTGLDFGLGNTFSPIVKSTVSVLLDQLKARINECTNLESLKQ